MTKADVALLARVHVEAALPDSGAAALNAQAHALVAVLELHVGDLDAAVLRERLPVGLKVLALEPLALNLFRE
jgi:hypothetical protein